MNRATYGWLPFSLAAALFCLAACAPPDDECAEDADCAQGELCVAGLLGDVCAVDKTLLVVPDDARACYDSRQCGGYACIDDRCATRCATDVGESGSDYGCRDGYACVELEGEFLGVCESAAGCEDDTDCAGARCIGDQCAAVCYGDADCLRGFACAGEPDEVWGECVPEAGAAPEVPCSTNAECGPYTCNDGTCFSFCLDFEQCRGGSACEIPDGEVVGSCAPVAPFTWVAVVSAAAGDESLAADSPGPEIDAVALVDDSTVVWATSVLSAAVGTLTGGNAVNGVPENVLGAPDDFTTPGGDCALDPEATTFAIGGAAGFVAVSFDGSAAIEDGATIRVIELAAGPSGCGNITTERPDTFDVYLGRGDGPATASDVVATGCRIGSSPSLGGVTEIFVDTATCN